MKIMLVEKFPNLRSSWNVPTEAYDEVSALFVHRRISSVPWTVGVAVAASGGSTRYIGSYTILVFWPHTVVSFFVVTIFAITMYMCVYVYVCVIVVSWGIKHCSRLGICWLNTYLLFCTINWPLFVSISFASLFSYVRIRRERARQAMAGVLPQSGKWSPVLSHFSFSHY